MDCNKDTGKGTGPYLVCNKDTGRGTGPYMDCNKDTGKGTGPYLVCNKDTGRGTGPDMDCNNLRPYGEYISLLLIHTYLLRLTDYDIRKVTSYEIVGITSSCDCF